MSVCLSKFDRCGRNAHNWPNSMSNLNPANFTRQKKFTAIQLCGSNCSESFILTFFVGD